MNWTRLRAWLAILGGSELPSKTLDDSVAFQMLMASWWLALLLIVLSFAGRNVKFVYVDF